MNSAIEALQALQGIWKHYILADYLSSHSGSRADKLIAMGLASWTVVSVQEITGALVVYSPTPAPVQTVKGWHGLSAEQHAHSVAHRPLLEHEARNEPGTVIGKMYASRSNCFVAWPDGRDPVQYNLTREQMLSTLDGQPDALQHRMFNFWKAKRPPLGRNQVETAQGEILTVRGVWKHKEEDRTRVNYHREGAGVGITMYRGALQNAKRPREEYHSEVCWLLADFMLRDRPLRPDEFRAEYEGQVVISRRRFVPEGVEFYNEGTKSFTVPWRWITPASSAGTDYAETLEPYVASAREFLIRSERPIWETALPTDHFCKLPNRCTAVPLTSEAVALSDLARLLSEVPMDLAARAEVVRLLGLAAAGRKA